MRPDPSSNPLSTGPALAAWHHDRARLYRAIAGSLRAAPDETGRRILLEGLAAPTRDEHLHAARAALLEALEAPVTPEVSDAHARLTPLWMGEGGGDEGHTCEERLVALQALAMLARRTSRALSSGDLPAAAGLIWLQARFIDEQVGDCLADLADALVHSGSPVHIGVGLALAGLVAADRKLLGEDAPPPPAGNPPRPNGTNR